MTKMASSKKKKSGKGGKKSKSTEVVYHSTKEIKVERELIENFIGLQRVMVSLSSKFENLSSQISRLLNLFEVSARALAKKEVSSGELDSRRVMEKLENISQQAGLIGKGLALIHEVGTENERPAIPVQKREGFQRSFQNQESSPAATPASYQNYQNVSSIGLSKQKITREIGESEQPKDRKLTEDANAGTNI